MRKTILGLSLAGILSIVGANTNALETKADGYEIPDIKNAKLFVTEKFNDSPKVIANAYLQATEIDEILIFEISINDKVYLYDTYKDPYGTLDSRRHSSHVIVDRNCDGVFETKYNFEDMEKMDEKDIPSCYLNKEDKLIKPLN